MDWYKETLSLWRSGAWQLCPDKRPEISIKTSILLHSWSYSSWSLILCVCVGVLSRVWFFATPWTITHQAPLSMGFLRQEYWNELPFHSQSRDWTLSPTLQVNYLPSEPPGKHKNTGVGSLSLLQGILPTQGLLHCRQILYQLSYRESPVFSYGIPDILNKLQMNKCWIIYKRNLTKCIRKLALKRKINS